MTRMASLLERNERFASTYSPVPLAVPAARVLILTCLDHRIDPAMIFGLRPADAPVIRNAGGRVTQSVTADIAYLGFLAERVFGESGQLFEVAVMHHTQCGTGFLADQEFLRAAAEATGLSDQELAASAVPDPQATVRTDVERLLTSPRLSPKMSVSGHVYEIETGRVTTVVAAKAVGQASRRGG